MRAISSLFVCLLLSACAAASRPVDTVVVAPGVVLALPAPAELLRTVDVIQLVTARHGDDVFVFEGRLSVGPGGLRLVGTDAMGRRAMDIAWNGGCLTVERASWLPERVRPENVLADIVLIYWPEAAVRRGLRGATLETGPGARTIIADGRAVIAIRTQGDPWLGAAQLSNTAWAYDIEVRSAGVGP